jgi:SAM-dependent methyltransferase
VLEVGAANGFRLAMLAERYGARAVGVEASAAAIADGSERYPAVELRRGATGALPVDEMFELVIVNFVFHWVDRSSLLASVAEIDRALADGGCLVLGDFLPGNRLRRSYHHRPEAGLWTFKQDYAAPFLASGLYQPLALLAGGHGSAELRVSATEDERVGTWLLRKQLTDLYMAERQA